MNKKTINKTLHVKSKNVETVFVTGIRGCGKSTYAKNLLKKGKRIIVFDPTGEYHRELGYIHITDIKELVKYVKSHYRKGFKISYKPMKRRNSDRKKHVNILADFLLSLQTSYFEGRSNVKITLLIEEMNKAYPNKDMEKKMPDFEELVTEGRHYGINLYGVNQSAVRVNTNFRDNITEEVLFKQSRRQLQDLSQAIGKEYAVQAIKQVKHHYIHIKDDDVTVGINGLS